MDARWTSEQILGLAPDAGSAKSGKDLASPRKWVSLGGDEAALWGLCQGSGKDPYQTQIDLSEPAFKCSCPSRKFPCKHALGLFLLAASQPGALAEKEPPSWVTEWLGSRAQKAEQRSRRVEQRAAGTDVGPDPEAQAKRVAERERKVAGGVAELRLWLEDLVRRGLGDPQVQAYAFWDGVAARMVDAQAPGLARRLRDLASIAASGDGWQGRLLEQLGRLHLLLEGHSRLPELPAPLQAEVRAQLGWTLKEEDLLTGEGARDRWLVLGQRMEMEERLRVQRTWLWGAASGRRALLLSFAHATQPLDTTLVPGTAVDAELVYYPGALPLRAAIRSREAPAGEILECPGDDRADAALAGFAAALARSPWLDTLPFSLRQVIPERSGDRWVVRDPFDRILPLAPRWNQGWKLMALSGGRPVGLFGEWTGEWLIPLSTLAEGRFYSLVQPQS